MYSKIHSRLDWFFGYIGDGVLLGDLNDDGILNIADVILIINIIINPDGGYVSEADMNNDGEINVLDALQIVSEILGTTFSQSVIWLEENFPELNVKERLGKLNKLQYFAK